MIESLSNQYIKSALKLKQKKYRHLMHQFLIEGEHLVQEALDASRVFKIYVRQGYQPAFTFGNIEVVSDKVMDALCDTQSHSNIVAICTLNDQAVTVGNTCICYQVQDPGNLGTIIRSAYAFGFTQCILVDCVDAYNDKTIRSSQGALFHVGIIQAKDIYEVIHQCHDFGISTVATSLHKAKPLMETHFHLPVAIILGNEGQGLPDEVVDACQQGVKIEMSAFESLNVAVAGSILMYTIQNLK